MADEIAEQRERERECLTELDPTKVDAEQQARRERVRLRFTRQNSIRTDGHECSLVAEYSCDTNNLHT